MRDIILDILKTSVYASSGDNSQPWRFEVEDNKIRIFNLPEKDNPILNLAQSGSFIAHGGLVENIYLAARQHGYNPQISLFPQFGNLNLVASITLENDTTQSGELYPYIKLRHTNRRPYKNTPLTQSQRDELMNVPKGMGLQKQAKVVLLENPDEKRIAAKTGSSMEQVILENRELHHLMFKDVLWTKKQNREKVSGLYIKTMEFAPPVKIVFWLASHWSVIKILNKIGLAKFIAKQDSKLYSSGAAMVAIIMEDNTKESFVCAGRVLQRLWLNATKIGLSFQPVTAIIFAGRRIETGDTDGFSQKHIEIIKKNYYELKKIYKLNANEVLAMMGRLGFSKAPSGHSQRFEPNITWKNSLPTP